VCTGYHLARYTVETEPEETGGLRICGGGWLFYLIGGRGIKHVEVFDPTTEPLAKKKKDTA
jgi:hypothetical protein